MATTKSVMARDLKRPCMHASQERMHDLLPYSVVMPSLELRGIALILFSYVDCLGRQRCSSSLVVLPTHT